MRLTNLLESLERDGSGRPLRDDRHRSGGPAVVQCPDAVDRRGRRRRRRLCGRFPDGGRRHGGRRTCRACPSLRDARAVRCRSRRPGLCAAAQGRWSEMGHVCRSGPVNSPENPVLFVTARSVYSNLHWLCHRPRKTLVSGSGTAVRCNSVPDVPVRQRPARRYQGREEDSPIRPPTRPSKSKRTRLRRWQRSCRNRSEPSYPRAFKPSETDLANSRDLRRRSRHFRREMLSNPLTKFYRRSSMHA